jgi:5-hydroxyisourate hydrolase-like protein (transthyretin family)
LVRSQAYYANSLAVQVIENYGQVRVADSATGQPLPKVYVKVYARMNDGRTRFYKDGYTDLRGRFDYASLSTNELDFVDRFALLVLSEQNGAVVREAAPPKR